MIAAAGSVSSQTTTSGRQLTNVERSPGARERATSCPKPITRSRASRSMSIGTSGRVTGSRPSSVPPGKHAKPSASTLGTIHGRPANATVWPAAVAARAMGTSGSR